MRFPSLLLAVASLSWLSLATTSGTLNGSGQSLNPRLTTIPLSSRDLPVGTCNSDTPCANGACCGSDNLCGYSDKSCGTGCQFNCDAKAECGPYAALGSQQCPLNVCCSEFGFCGSTSEFCSWKNADDPLYPTCDTQYGGCGDVTRPSCSGNSVAKRNIGYYESWSNTRKCQSMAPEDLNVDQFSHINFAFSFFDPTTFQITPMDANGASLYHRFTALKSQKASLETWISVGGWSFTDPGATQTAFSDMSSSSENRQKFISGLIKFMSTYGFDGVDLDWEYPGADDRGGSEDDVANYVTLVADMKSAFGSKYGLTVTLPTSYWYLQHFDLAGLEENVDWFNVMAYDLHGVWDRDSKNLGPYIAPHTNITEIDLALDLIWRSGVKSDKVVMGQGWYGRSFTLVDPSCNTPNGVCEFSAGANAGPCSNAAGILDLQEINDIISTKSLKPVHDQKAGVKWITWDSNQWVSYDDADTFKQKRDFANSRCLGGLMVWAMDQIDQSSSSSYSAAPVVSSDQLSSAKQASADQQASITCYTSDCNSPCKVGTNSIAEMNGQPGQLSTANRCTKGEYRKLCCESATVVGKCQWRGFRGAGLACTSGCADGETELVKDTNNHDSKKGDQTCNGGLQSYCCSGYKPAPSKATLAKEVADKAKEAAKAAAEAAAEQVALDIAAKAFCRVAVPALLLPLELLEDLIPIVGEILDAIEIAATPAIIQGCVKGIEKEGKAEFKVFGKKHTVSMDKPTATPTKEIPAAKTNNPPKTSEKPPSCSTKSKAKLAKRAPPATAANKRKYVDDDPMKVLVRTAKRANEAWKDGDGWAIMQAWPPTGIVPIPEHYLLVVGIVSVKIETEDVKDCNGKVTGQNEIWTRNYVARPYDIAPSNDPALDKKCVLIPRSAKTSTWWLNKGANSAYTDEGAINPIFSTEENIKKIALARADAMGKYSYTMNNCRTYTDDLAAHLK